MPDLRGIFIQAFLHPRCSTADQEEEVAAPGPPVKTSILRIMVRNITGRKEVIDDMA